MARTNRLGNLYCANDGKPLTGKQTRFCSTACQRALWNKQHLEQHAARMRAVRERERLIKAGQPLPLTDLERRLADLAAENTLLRASLWKETVE